MSAPNPKLYVPGTTTLLPPFAFGTVTPPGTSVTWSWDLANSGATSDPMTEVWIGMQESDDNGTTWINGAAATGMWVQVRLTAEVVDAGTNSIEPQSTSWTPIGLNRRLSVKPIPGGTRRAGEMKVVVPAGVSPFTGKLIRLVPYWSTKAVGISSGFFAGGIHGVVSGASDNNYAGLLLGGKATASATPDGNINFTETTVVRLFGVPCVNYPSVLAVAASSSGHARWVTVYSDGSGTFQTIESAEVTAPAPLTDRPEAPAGTVIICDIHRDSGAIDPADIYTTRVFKVPFGFSSSGLSYTVGPGQAMVDDRLITVDTPQTGTMPASSNFYMALTPDGGIGISPAGSNLDPHEEELWGVHTDATHVTSLQDVRNMLVPRGKIYWDAHFDAEPALNEMRYWHSPFDTYFWPHFPEGFSMSVGSMGDRTTGNLVVDVLFWNGTTWQTLFSNTAMRPTMAYNDTDLQVRNVYPDGLWGGGYFDIPPGRLAVKVITKPTGGTVGPTGIVVKLVFEIGFY